MSSAGEYRTPAPAQKLKMRGQEVFALSGEAALFEPMIEWYLAGANPKEVPTGTPGHTSSLVVFKAGRCFSYKTTLPYPDEFFAPDAWGSGQDFAIGAMKGGADAKRAVEIAIDCNPHTGGKVQAIDLSFQTEGSLKAVAAE
jgi:hypothetical protein